MFFPRRVLRASRVRPVAAHFLTVALSASFACSGVAFATTPGNVKDDAFRKRGTNAALRKPCEPAPFCSTIFDGDLATGFLVASIQHSLLPVSSQHGEVPKGSVKIFLQSQISIDRVVVLCDSTHNGGDPSASAASSLPHAIQALQQRQLSLTLSDDGKSQGNLRKSLLHEIDARSHKIVVSPVVTSEGGRIRLEFPINQVAAVVTLQLDTTTKANQKQAKRLLERRDAWEHLCGEMPISEVAVVAVDEADAGSVEAKAGMVFDYEPRSEDLARVHAPPRRQAEIELIDAEPSNPLRGSDFAAHTPLQGIPHGAAPFGASRVSVVAPFAVSRASLRAIMPWFVAVFGVGPLCLALFMPVCLAMACAGHVLKSRMMATQTSLIGTHPSMLLQTQALTPTAFFWIGESEAEASENEKQETPAHTSFFWIGDSDAPAVETPNPSPPSTPRTGPASLSSAVPRLQTGHLTPYMTPQQTPQTTPRQGASETEPEAELYPENENSVTEVSTRSQHLPGNILDGVSYTRAAEPVLPPLALDSTLAVTRVEPASQTAPTPSSGSTRVTFLYASPLCRMDAARGPVAMQMIPFEREWAMLRQAFDEASVASRSARLSGRSAGNRWRREPATLSAQPLTSSTLQRAVTPSVGAGVATVLHLSAHGNRESLVLEDGKCTAHLLSCELLKSMLSLSEVHGAPAECPRLVILNACSSHQVGQCFIESGVPHVLCTLVDLRDSWSDLFFRVMYSSLFQGKTVGNSFQAALVALRCDSEIPASAADAFCLLPEGELHDEVVFPSQMVPSTSAATPRVGSASNSRVVLHRSQSQDSSTSGREDSSDGEGIERASSDDTNSANKCFSKADMHIVSRKSLRRHPAQLLRRAAAVPPQCTSLFEQSLPQMPDDFAGRSLDVWCVLQHLSSRRAVVLCGGDKTNHGIGKSTVLDAVHRVSALQTGAACVSVKLHALSDPGDQPEVWWINRVRVALRRAIQTEQHGRRQGSSGSSSSSGLESSLSRKCMRSRLLASGRSRRRAQESTAPSNESSPSVALEALITDMGVFAELWRQGGCDRDISGGRGKDILLLLDECDHLIQQQHFQKALAEVLRNCTSYRIVLTSQQRMMGTAGGQFKVVHHALEALAPSEAARLFLRRSQRPLRWDELPALPGTADRAAPTRPGMVVLNREFEAEAVARVVAHPAVALHAGNPRGLIELAALVKPSLASLWELSPDIATPSTQRGRPEQMEMTEHST